MTPKQTKPKKKKAKTVTWVPRDATRQEIENIVVQVKSGKKK